MLLGVGRAQNSSCIPGEGIQDTQPASAGPRAQGWVAALAGWASTNRLVEGGHREGKSAM